MSIESFKKQPKRFYKYKSFKTSSDIDQFLDIIWNNRLYCAEPKQLNDPMEAYIDFRYGSGIKFSCQDLARLRDLTRVCALSEVGPTNPDSILMWTHYADQFNGACIEVEILDDNIKGDFIEDYVVGCVHYEPAFDEITDIDQWLLNKLSVWKYEREHRVLITLDEGVDKTKKIWVPIRVHKIVLGYNVSNNVFLMVKAAASAAGKDPSIFNHNVKANNENNFVWRMPKRKVIEIMKQDILIY